MKTLLNLLIATCGVLGAVLWMAFCVGHEWGVWPAMGGMFAICGASAALIFPTNGS